MVIDPVQPDQFDAEVRALALPGYLGLLTSGSLVDAVYADALTQTQADLVFAAGAAHSPDPAYQTKLNRTVSQSLFSDSDPRFVIARALVLTLLDEVNLLRQRLADQDAAVAAATSLADLKTRWAAVASADPVPQRTAAQAKSAVANKIQSGSAD
jgi:hypothetical protein